MAMLRALPYVKLGNFTPSLMRNKKLDLAIASAAFHIEQVERDAVHGPVLMPAGDAALFPSSSPSSSKASTSKDALCIVCNQGNHPLEKCCDLIKAKELCAERQKSYNKDQRARRAAGTTATAPAVVEAALAASLHSSTPSGSLADAHWIADTGATSHMTPYRSWFVQYGPFVTPIRVANHTAVFSEGVGTIVLQPTAPVVAAVSAGQEAIWMRQFLGELGYAPAGPALMLMDNQSAMQVAKNPEHHGCMKHLDLRFFWLRDEVTKRHLAGTMCPQLTWLPTSSQSLWLVSRFSMVVSSWVLAHLLVLGVLDDSECQYQEGVLL
jgi:hypothetical protein